MNLIRQVSLKSENISILQSFSCSKSLIYRFKLGYCKYLPFIPSVGLLFGNIESVKTFSDFNPGLIEFDRLFYPASTNIRYFNNSQSYRIYSSLISLLFTSVSHFLTPTYSIQIMLTVFNSFNVGNNCTTGFTKLN
jgi:hypothetical protein